jgi:hypothetical protein
MKYMLLIYGDENALSEKDRETCYEESLDLVRDLQASGAFVAASPLQHTRTAASLRIREQKRLLTDGPFAETKEQLGGFFMVETATADEAIAIAERIPAARWGTVEIRPVVELAGMPA